MLASEKTIGGGQKRDRRETEKEKYCGEGEGGGGGGERAIGRTSTKFCMIRDQSLGFSTATSCLRRSSLISQRNRESDFSRYEIRGARYREKGREKERERERERKREKGKKGSETQKAEKLTTKFHIVPEE